MTALWVGGGASPALAASEEGVHIPSHFDDSVASASTSEGWRVVNIGNGLSPDYMTLDIWENGRIVFHHDIPPHTTSYSPGLINIFDDVTVTRWSTCTGVALPDCRIAGSYKFSAIDNPNSWVNPAFFPPIIQAFGL